MKKTFFFIQSILFIFILTSCGGQKNTPENQPVTTPTSSTQKADSEKTGSNMTGDQSKKSDGTQTAGGQQNDAQTGSQIIDFSVNKLTSRINLKSEQINSIKDILTKAFTAKGYDLNKTYTFEESKEMSKDLIKNSRDAISGTLDADQKALFNNLGHH